METRTARRRRLIISYLDTAFLIGPSRDEPKLTRRSIKTTVRRMLVEELELKNKAEIRYYCAWMADRYEPMS